MKKGTIRRSRGTGSLQREPTGVYTIRVVYNGQRFAKSTGTRDHDKALKMLEEFVAPFVHKDKLLALKMLEARVAGVEKREEIEAENRTQILLCNSWWYYIDSCRRRDVSERSLVTKKNVWENFVNWIGLVYEELRKKFPYLKPSEIKELAEEIAEGKTNGSLIKEAMSTAGRIALQSAAAAGISAAMDIALQYVLTRKIDVRRVALTAGATAIGTSVGQLTTIVFIKTRGGANAVRILQRAFRLRSASLMRNSLAGGVGAVATSGILAYGRVWLGRSSWGDAHQEFISGIAGTAGGALVVTGVTSAVAAWGTAGTGTAIASLSGAAQTNAILAWLGMGGGKFVGGIVLGGVGVVATIVVGFGASFAISKIRESLNRDYLILKGEKFGDLCVWSFVASRNLKGLPLY